MNRGVCHYEGCNAGIGFGAHQSHSRVEYYYSYFRTICLLILKSEPTKKCIFTLLCRLRLVIIHELLSKMCICEIRMTSSKCLPWVGWPSTDSCGRSPVSLKTPLSPFVQHILYISYNVKNFEWPEYSQITWFREDPHAYFLAENSSQCNDQMYVNYTNNKKYMVWINMWQLLSITMYD